MNKVVKCYTGVSAWVDCGSIIDMICSKVAKSAGCNPREIIVDEKMLTIGGTTSKINWEKCFDKLVDELCFNIAVNVVDFEFLCENSAELGDDYCISIEGTEIHDAYMHIEADTWDTPGCVEIEDAKVSFDEKNTHKKAMKALKEIDLNKFSKIFAKENFSFENEDTKSKLVDSLVFTNKEIKEMLAHVDFGWYVSDDYSIEEV